MEVEVETGSMGTQIRGYVHKSRCTIHTVLHNDGAHEGVRCRGPRILEAENLSLTG